MNDQPLITTVIPTYKRPKLLQRAIKSVLSQTYQNFQICIYDNASMDETAQIVSEFSKKDNRVKYFCHSKNIGASNNFFYGMKNITTQFFSLLSDDDILLPNFYETALDGFNKYPDAAFSCTSTITMDNNNKIIAIPLALWKEGFYYPPEGLISMLKYYHPTWTGILFSKKIIDEGILFDSTIKACSDLDFELRLASKFPFIVSLKSCAILMYHAETHSACKSYNDLWPEWSRMIDNLKNDGEISIDIKIFAEKVLKERLMCELSFIAINNLISKNYNDISKIVEIIKNYCNFERKAKRIAFAEKLCEKSILFHFFISKFLIFRRFYYSFLQMRKNKEIIKKFNLKNILSKATLFR